MPMGTGAPTLQNLPANNFVVDPAAFMAMTSKQVYTTRAQAAPGAGSFFTAQLPQVGVLSKARVIFAGNITVAVGGATANDEWPHNLLSKMVLGVNGQNDLFSLSGVDLHALRFVRFPAFEDQSDYYPGTAGGSSAIAAGSYGLYLTWEVPICVDETTLVGSLYAQSAATQIAVEATQATADQLFSVNPSNVTITGTFFIQTTHFEIPYNAESQLVIPDLSKLHGVTGLDYPLQQTGESRFALIRNAGQLHRLFLSSRSSLTNRLTPLSSAAATRKIDRVRLEYGGNKVPMDYNPGSSLIAENNQFYGAPVPYDRWVFDFVRENPIRDVVLLQGLTEFAVVPTVNAGVTITAGEAKTRVVQETLF